MKTNSYSYHRGQSLVELALLLPALLLLTVVTLDLGRGIYYYSVIYNAAREGARYGIVHQQPYNTIPIDITRIEAAARNLMAGLDQDLVNVPTPTINGDMLQVTVEYEFVLITPLARFVTSCHCGHLDLSSTSTMLIER